MVKDDRPAHVIAAERAAKEREYREVMAAEAEWREKLAVMAEGGTWVAVGPLDMENRGEIVEAQKRSGPTTENVGDVRRMITEEVVETIVAANAAHAETLFDLGGSPDKHFRSFVFRKFVYRYVEDDPFSTAVCDSCFCRYNVAAFDKGQTTCRSCL